MTDAPFMRTPFSDITGFLVSHQYFGRCGKMELKAMECVEAYGVDASLDRCKDLIDDACECHLMTKQLKRFNIKDEVARAVINVHLANVLGSLMAERMLLPHKLAPLLNLQRLAMLWNIGVTAEDSKEVLTPVMGVNLGAMRRERDRQIACGILKGDAKYVNPDVDAY